MTYFIFALIAGAAAGLVTKRFLAATLNFIIFLVLAWCFMPTLAFGFYPTAIFFAAMALSVWLWTLVLNDLDESTKSISTIFAFTGAFALLIVIPLLTTWGAFHDDAYRGLLDVEEKDFDTGQVLLDQTQARFVDQELAVRAAHELLGNQQGLGSMVDIGTMSIQSVKGRLWWVGQLEHKTIAKWLTNETTPGYVMVSASNYSDRRIVLGQKYRIGMKAFFSDNLVRHLYQSGFATTGFDDYTFELDDEGNAHWVVTSIAPKVGFDGFVAIGIAIVDPTSGAVQHYGMDDAPAWVDRIEPAELIEERINDWGTFVKGWWNQLTSGNDVIQASKGMALVYTKQGHAAWYTGMQSTSNNNAQDEQSTMAFMLVDTRTGKASFYRRAGITEDAAKKALEGAVQEKQYSATHPIPYLVDGVPTFISVLKDVSGNMQMVGLVSYNDRSILSVADNLPNALRTYSARLRGKGTGIAIGSTAEKITLEGTIVRWGTEQIKDDSYVTFMIDTIPNKAFSMSERLSPEVIISKIGDHVKFQVTATGVTLIGVDGFDNLEINLTETGDEKILSERYQEAIKARQERQNAMDANTLLKNVDPETLTQILEAIRKAKSN
ncbi:MAG: hypothetical protein IPL73_00550 [Candidatus Obscuribacter sp.]|nr:hypothetical protein [Candidatus Obscuribacter sp.]